MKKVFTSVSLWVLVLGLGLSYYVGQKVEPTWAVEKIAIDVQRDEEGKLYYLFKGKPVEITPVPIAKSTLREDHENDKEVKTEYVYEKSWKNGKPVTSYYQLNLIKHFRYWSFLPIAITIILCWVIKEPIAALFAGVLCGAFILSRFDITEDVLLSTFMSKNAAGVLILYLWLLGGLLGMWSRTGAAKAFAEFVTKRCVRGPRSAKLVAWFLGVFFFQGGTVSSLLVGTTVKPITDQEKISHEELSYIVDSTAAPIACVIAFNAWPLYIQAFLYVGGISWLATESDRLRFFFQSVPFSFYAFFALAGTFLLSIEKNVFIGKRLKKAITRSRTTGRLDAYGAEPLSAKELSTTHVPHGYEPHIAEFLVPMISLIAVAVATFVIYGSPKVRWAFGAALMIAFVMAMARGMKLKQAMEGIANGCKGVVFGTIILLLAITIGKLTKEIGGPFYLVDVLGASIPYWLLPLILQVLTMIISFSTGTSWGTYAVTYPLAMPLAWAIAQSSGVAHPKLFMMICFATVLNGSVYGDQCSPISDTTVVASMSTGTDLMDHVMTQMPQATFAAVLAAICWTLTTLIFV